MALGNNHYSLHPLFFPLVLTSILFLSACGGEQNTLEQQDNILTYAALNPVSAETRGFVNDFNQLHTDVQLEIRDYSDEGGIQRLLLEMMLGQVPDIMELHYFGKNGPTVSSSDRNYHQPVNSRNFNVIPGSYAGSPGEYWMPYRQMAQKGYLEDLWPYIEDELGRDGVLQAPLKAAEVNGGLYMLFQRVTIFTLTGRESMVGARFSWTLEDVMEAYASMPAGSTILRYDMTKRDVFFNLLCNSIEQYVDRESGECAFDSKSFCDLVDFLAMFPDELDDKKSQEAEQETMQAIQQGKQMLEGMQIVWPRCIGYSDAIWRERASFVGYPTSDGSSGSFFYATGHKLAMSSTCRNKDAAWDFMRDLIRPRLKKGKPLAPLTDIPINLSDYEMLIWGEIQEAKKLARQFPQNPLAYFPATRHFTYGPKIPLMHLITEEDTQRFRDLVDHTTRIYWPDDALADIVWEALGPYFAGDKPLDDTLRLLDNRVSLYLNEQK